MAGKIIAPVVSHNRRNMRCKNGVRKTMLFLLFYALYPAFTPSRSYLLLKTKLLDLQEVMNNKTCLAD